LSQNIERVQVLGQVIAGSSGQSLLQTTLTIAPAGSWSPMAIRM
jgi:hypothetical protein